MRTLVLVLALVACGDNQQSTVIDAGGDAGPTVLAACLDRPDDLPRPPAGQLPCELLPPGFVAGGSP